MNQPYGILRTDPATPVRPGSTIYMNANADQTAGSKFRALKAALKTTPARIFLGCAAGALALLAVIHLPDFLIQALTGRFGDSGQLGTWLTGLSETIGLMLKSAVTTPWGVVGALVGLSIALYKLRQDDQPAQPGTDATSPSSDRMMPGELTLAAGMLLTLLSVGIFPSVMVWMLALFTLPAGLVLGLRGIMSIRGNTPERVRWTGLAALLIAAITMIMGAVAATYLSCVIIDALDVVPALAPELGGRWLLMLAGWGLAVLSAHRGLRTWTDWTPGRRRFWVLAVAFFPVAAFLVHFTLAASGFLPLSA